MVALALLCGLACPATPLAQAQPAVPAPLTVGVYVSPPFVIEENGRYSGMAIELWQALATANRLPYEFQEFQTFGDLVQATAAGEADVAVTNLTITQARAERIDFTQPWFDAGLRIMVRDRPRSGFWSVLYGLQASGHLRAYAWIAIVVLVATALLAAFDRHFDRDFPKRWRDGLAESFFAVMSVATSGRPPARKNLFGWVGRIWSALWLVCGIAVLAYVTSSVTSVMTTLSLTSQVNGLSDLPGKTVGVFTGSIAEEFARGEGLRNLSFPLIDEAVAALDEGRIDAIVADAPVLEYHAHNRPDSALSVVGNIFAPDKYGFGLPHRSPLARDMTVELLGAQETGVVEDLRVRYFGAQ